MAEVEKIGRHYYAKLKSMAKSQLTLEQQEQIKSFETPYELTPEQIEAKKEYAKKLFEPLEVLENPLEKTVFWNEFIHIYKEYYNKSFQSTEESVENIKPIMRYFLKDEAFFDSSRLYTKINEPSFDKGLLIIGDYGNGKSSIMKTIHLVLQTYPSLSFAYRSANDVVSDFEKCKEAVDKEIFWRNILAGRCFFDDVKTEREASNYGKVNLFKDIIERRYDKKVITHLSCNYHPEHPNDIEAGLEEFGEMYGGRVYDRLKEQYNIIEFKGQSFRK